jgi:hypothetical protein
MIIFYCHRFETPPTWRAGPLIYIPQALGSLFIVSYDSQGHGGGIRTRLHTGTQQLNYWSSLYSPDTERVFLRCRETCPQSCSLATAVVLSPVYTAVTWQWVSMSQYLLSYQVLFIVLTGIDSMFLFFFISYKALWLVPIGINLVLWIL